MLGFKGPRKMTIIIPAMSVDQQRFEISPLADHDTIIGEFVFPNNFTEFCSHLIVDQPC